MRRARGGEIVAGLLLAWASPPMTAWAQAEPVDGPTEPVEAEPPEAPVEVIVQGSPAATTPDDPTPAVFALGRERLDAPGATLAQTLATVPGVQVSRSGGDADAALARLRGGRSAQTPVFLAGVRLDDELTGGIDLSTLSPSLFHRATVYRGHGPRQGDALGIGGAIWLEPRLPRGSGGEVAAGAGSFGRREARAGLTLGGDEVAASAGATYRGGRGDFSFVDDNGTRFDASDDVERRRANADYDGLDAWSILRWSGRDHRLTLLVHGFRRAGGAPGLQLVGAREARLDTSRALGAVAADVSCASGGWCRLQLASSLVQSTYRLDDPLGELGAATRVTNQSQSTRHRLRAELAPRDDLRVDVGMTYLLSRLEVGPTSARRQLLRPQLDAWWRPLPGLDVTAIAALPCHAFDGQGDGAVPFDDGTCGVLAPVGRLGLRYRPLEPLALFANGGRYVRVPTLGERFGVSAAVRGNPELVEERGWSGELGVATQGGAGVWSWWAQVVGFGIFSDDLVAYRRASVGAVRPYNVGQTRSLGLEVAAGVDWSRWVTLDLALTALDPRDVTEGRQLASDLLPFTARWVAVPGLTLRSPAWPRIGLQQARLGTRFRFQASRVADPAGLVELAEQRLWSLQAALAFVGEVELGLEVTNLLDQRTVDFIGYPLPGRAFFLRSSARW